MRKTTNDKRQDNGEPSACPHCGAGGDRITVGLYWDLNECCWHCFVCGCRAYEEAVCLTSTAESLWDRICDDLDEVKSTQEVYHDRDQETIYSIHGASQDGLMKDFSI